MPYNRIELTPMIGGTDTIDETFSLADVDRMSSWATVNGAPARIVGLKSQFDNNNP